MNVPSKVRAKAHLVIKLNFEYFEKFRLVEIQHCLIDYTIIATRSKLVFNFVPVYLRENINPSEYSKKILLQPYPCH